MSEDLRIEIHEAQNIVERINSIMSFIFYGKLGEISTNIKTEQELSRSKRKKSHFAVLHALTSKKNIAIHYHSKIKVNLTALRYN